MTDHPSKCFLATECVQRRGFLQATATGAATLVLGEVFPGRVAAQDQSREAHLTSYERQLVADLADIKPQEPIEFSFPDDGLHRVCLLIQLKGSAGGGVGDEQSIVAFSGRCTHMGGDLLGGYVAEHSVIGCGEHLTTFDLTRHGIMVAGHATQALPQIVLEVEDGKIYATGIVGLVYGYSSNQSPDKE